MHYGILGTTTAHHDDGTPIALGGARLRALLAALVLRQGRAVPAEVLVAEVWDDELPRDAGAALQTLVGRLRRTIGRAEVGSGPGGYWLTGARSDLDRFQELAALGQRALAAGDAKSAAEQLREALALWRGPALADLPDRAGSAVRLEAQRDEVRRARIGADLALGQAVEVAAELAGLCADHPLDEPLHVLWIRALHQVGRTAEALERYEGLRRALAERLGTDPGAELRAVHQELLRQLPAEPPAQVAARIPAEPVSPGPAVPAAGNLRPRLTSFVGREQDLHALAELIGSARLITLTGPGGSGKTRLSVEAGRLAQAEAYWPDGVWLAELAPLESPAAVPGAVLSALGLRATVLHQSLTEGRPDDPVRRIVEHCGRARMLLLLDNCEHLIQAAAELADQLLAECPQLSILATSREPLGVPGEAVLPVEPLPDPIALRLLGERGAAARAGFTVADDPAACAEICRRLDGLPLAIELAAARLRGLTPRQLADRLDSRFALLTGGSRVLLPRQQTLRAVVDWSWELLDERERAVLRRLSVFAGGAGLTEAELVCADGELVRGEQVAELLLSLVDKSLLVAGLDPQGPPRYRMLETIHEYAVERLAESKDGAAAERHLTAFRELACTAQLNLHSHQQAHWLVVLEREQDNIRAALRHALDTRAEQEALSLLLSMMWFWMLRDFRAEARSWLDQVCALGADPFTAEAAPPEPLDLGPLEYPLPWSAPVLAEARRQVWLYQLVSHFEFDQETLDEGALSERARQILRIYHPDLPQSYSYPPLLRIFACFLTEQPDSLLTLIDRAVEGCRRHGRQSELAWALQLRAKFSNDLVGGLEQARLDGDEAMAIYTRLGDNWGISETLTAQAETAGYFGDTAGAIAAYRRAIELAQELGAPQEVPFLQVRLGEALLETDEAEGVRLIRVGLAGSSSGSQEARGALVYGHLLLSSLALQRDQFAVARAELEALREARAGFESANPGIMGALVSCADGAVLARCGDVDEGVEQLRTGLRVLREAPSTAVVFAQHVTLMLLPSAVAVVLARAQRDGDRALAERACLLYAAHSGRMNVRGMCLERMERDRQQRALIEVLGEEGFEQTCEQGRTLAWEATAALLDALVEEV
ncbi:BTAD domain-containing putative transcriptional regulator [Kitasatospora kifunensis]|uniref:Putative ATPase/DNA-binding SARP family transcriptional activator n=1 Tax=Kitasatospora kifunensis TaxID=58351 RepID=A0A7W7R024_KITKI|nr:putative ATPase/DNA-binding SARP family transcriptional activator [Kitasatospora kifunensis]